MLGGAPGDRHVTDWVLAGDLRVGQTVVWSQYEQRVIQSVDQRDGHVVLRWDGRRQSFLRPDFLVPIASSVAEAAA